MSYGMWIAPKGDTWVELHTEHPPRHEYRDLASDNDATFARAWPTTRVELSWADVSPVTVTTWYLSMRPMTRRELRGPRWRKMRRQLRRTGFRQAWA